MNVCCSNIRGLTMVDTTIDVTAGDVNINGIIFTKNLILELVNGDAVIRDLNTNASMVVAATNADLDSLYRAVANARKLWALK